MAFKEYSAEQQMLSNKHFKEWKDNEASEKQVLYNLHCKHGVERDELVFGHITDTEKRIDLTHQQQEELNTLKQQNSERRMAIQKRHLNEQDSLQRKWTKLAEPHKTIRKVQNQP